MASPPSGNNDGIADQDFLGNLPELPHQPLTFSFPKRMFGKRLEWNVAFKPVGFSAGPGFITMKPKTQYIAISV